MLNIPVLILCLTLALPSAVIAETDTATRAKILIDEMEALYRGDASKAKITMRVETPYYQRSMKMESSNLGTEKAFIRILSPKKERGISTLKINQEMWNYLPKINKVIKVPPSLMMGSWMGSDFTNDDLVKQTTLTQKYELSMTETEDTFVVTLTPREQTVTVWGKIEYTVNKVHQIPVSQNFYDDNDKLIRSLLFKEPKLYQGRLLPSVLEMIPLNKEGHKTVIIYEELDFSPTDVDENIFSLRNLRKRF
ncbi:MAG: outer membrane lipoprotein-sorting protein [Candidatus Azotimanducaceae bacterium]|jgi:outer membrane lipoprotein-sorting protein